MIRYDNNGDHNLHFSQKDTDARRSSVTRLRRRAGTHTGAVWLQDPRVNHSMRLPSCIPTQSLPDSCQVTLEDQEDVGASRD